MEFTKLNIDRETDKLIEYYTKKKAWDYGYIKYSIVKQSIKHVTGINKIYLIRKIFLYMIEQGIFIKKQNKLVKSYLYKFKNPNNLKTEQKIITINFE
tara:strand:+ start:505 stop:798 length:294 start_codon:yes stop_codon:yes gene_type:complete